MCKQRCVLAVLVAMFFCSAVAKVSLASEQALKQVNTPLQLVGKTRVQVFLFKVYDATLETDTGTYPEYQRLRLSLRYLRSIRSSALVEETEKEWLNQGFEPTPASADWLRELSNIWPSVTAGDVLIAEHISGEGIRFLSAEGVLGTIQSEQFAERFLAIWLSENSRFKQNRDELVGL